MHVEGNHRFSEADLAGTILLKSGSSLSRTAVVADIARIEARYRRAGMSVRVITHLTRPGEHEGTPRTVLTYTLVENVPQPATTDDPLEQFYGNTLVCAAAKTGNDLCHTWFYRDGTFINFDAGEAKAGHYATGPMRADGQVPVCQYWDTPNMVTPAELKPPMPAAPNGGVTICRNHNFRTTCQHGIDPATLSEAERKLANRTMAERFYDGMCYPLGGQQVGDIWFDSDTPLPGQLGKDRLLLLPGHQ
jgi:hypothetical protein